ncbi:hypothetical protein J6W20_00090 [bacterium]|nr:hypothetical protein [bacterium]
MLPYFFTNFPKPLFENNMAYIEPFVGGGQLFLIYFIIINYQMSIFLILIKN